MIFYDKVDVENTGESELTLRRSFKAPRSLVWRAHTEPALVKRWMNGPPGWSMPFCEIDLQVGGRYRYEWKHENGCEMGMSGVHLEVAAPQKLVSTQLFDQDWTGGEAVATLILTEADSQTLLTNIIRYASAEARAQVLASGAMSGMEMGYTKLSALLSEQA